MVSSRIRKRICRDIATELALRGGDGAFGHRTMPVDELISDTARLEAERYSRGLITDIVAKLVEKDCSWR